MMFLIVFFIRLASVNLLFGLAPEPAALLAFGVGLVGATAMLRRFLKRGDDERAEGDSEIKG